MVNIRLITRIESIRSISSLNKQQLTKRIAAANHSIPADLVIKNGKIVDLYNLEIFEADVAITDGVFVGIGEFTGKTEMNAKGRYIVPSFIDSHVHIESSMITPDQFSEVVLSHGTTTVITDPHEIANVSGTEGLKFMLDASAHVPIDILLMLPSCVPATPFENAGAELTARDLDPFFSHARVLGLAEVMDYPAVMNGSESMIDKLLTALKYTDQIDGHLAGLDKKAINIYRTAGIRTDHECVTAEEARDRIQRGMYVFIREGSGAKDLRSVISAVNVNNARRFSFCTDDKHLNELIEEGGIDHNVRLAIQHGLDPLLAYQLASLNAADCFGLRNKGAIAPGYDADFLLVDRLEEVSIHQVFKSGKLVAQNGSTLSTDDNNNDHKLNEHITNTVVILNITEQDLKIPILRGNKANVIGIQPNSIHTKHLIEEVSIENNEFICSTKLDQLKIAVIERHKMTGNIGLGIVKGLQLSCGAIASTVAHDSHNLVVSGTNDKDMMTAICAIKEMEGGLVVVKDDLVIASVPLRICGLMSVKSYDVVYEELKQLNTALQQIHAPTHFNPFLTLSFLCLPVIPSLKVTDMGLFDVKVFKHIDVSAK
ncbi:adenine deaminase [Chengkuizengella axinellae]|uniref:Adenine deaminase n=1 Tax=Chengkuizengella axinellae TaxID=3064388 RepID=A0ABT9IXY9_9BACL|nr:adenine deaminase [Chengkuizengella sp. 2205SS18-9]MDP5274190.1 adenine deaminase [Chengkuizengella sp. 2205SS18-9]